MFAKSKWSTHPSSNPIRSHKNSLLPAWCVLAPRYPDPDPDIERYSRSQITQRLTAFSRFFFFSFHFLFVVILFLFLFTFSSLHFYFSSLLAFLLVWSCLSNRTPYLLILTFSFGFVRLLLSRLSAFLPASSNPIPDPFPLLIETLYNIAFLFTPHPTHISLICMHTFSLRHLYTHVFEPHKETTNNTPITSTFEQHPGTHLDSTLEPRIIRDGLRPFLDSYIFGHPQASPKTTICLSNYNSALPACEHQRSLFVIYLLHGEREKAGLYLSEWSLAAVLCWRTNVLLWLLYHRLHVKRSPLRPLFSLEIQK